MRLKLVLILLSLFSLLKTNAQELNCSVDVNTQQVQSSDKRIFETLKNSMYEFLNNKSWTGYDYKLNERIECSILLTVNERNGDQFNGTLTIASQRPVYNSTYNTVLLNTVDKDIDFSYVEYQPLDFNENTFTSNLTSILAYYAYIIIGLDFDSFTLNGGSQFFQVAQNIVNVAQNSSNKGWRYTENRKNRYWLVENLTNPAYDPIHKFFYEYHLKGLDMMYEDPDKGRANILKSLNYLQETKRQRAGLLILQLIADAKRDEIVNVFSKGSTAEKSQAVTIMKDLDPSHSSTYQKILH